MYLNPLLAFLLSTALLPGASTQDPPQIALAQSFEQAVIATPPESLGLDPFYRKYTDAFGVPIISSEKVPDTALLIARDVVNYMLSKRPDVKAVMVQQGFRVGIMAHTEMQTDLPEYSDWETPGKDDRRLTPRERENYDKPGGIGSMTGKEYWNRRARGMGGRYTTCAEENILGYPDTRYYGENILVHEFSHGIMSALRRVPSLPYPRSLTAIFTGEAFQRLKPPKGSSLETRKNPGYGSGARTHAVRPHDRGPIPGKSCWR